MLILGRRENESIIIGENIRITVTKITPFSVRIGIDAPEDVEVHREEIYRKLRKNGTRRVVSKRDIKIIEGKQNVEIYRSNLQP